MKLDARFVSLIYKIDTVNPSSNDIPDEEGLLWINIDTQTVFISVKLPNSDKIAWINIGNGLDNILNRYSLPTYNIIDIFNDNSIVAFYPFNNNAYDLANGYNGKWIGSEQYSTGVFDKAAKFDGNSWIKTGFNPDDSLVSMSFWIKTSLNKNQFICGTDNKTSTTRNFRLALWDNNNILNELQLWSGNTQQDIKVLYSNFQILPNKWYHIYLLIDIVNSIAKLFVNGNLIGTLTNPYSGFDELYIAKPGSYNNDKIYLFEGFIDQLRIFNRPLTPEEIIILYNENYLIRKGISILQDKIRSFKETVFYPCGDLPLKTGTSFYGGRIGKITDNKPVVMDIHNDRIGKELYFPDNTAIELKFDQDLTVPLTITTIFEVEKLEKTNGFFDKVLFGLDYWGQPPDDNFDLFVYLRNGNEGISSNIGDHSKERNLVGSSPYIPIKALRKYLLIQTITKNSAKLQLFDFNTKTKVGEIQYATGQLTKLREPRIALGAWIYTNDSSNSPNKFNHFSNCGLHINQFRIFNKILNQDEIDMLLNEDKMYTTRTQYTKQVFAKPTLDNKLLVFYNFDKIDKANNKIIDLSGNGRHGVLKLGQNESIDQAFTNGVYGKALDCKGINNRVTINNLPSGTDFITVSFWMYWTGCNDCMPFGFNHYDLWILKETNSNSVKFGFNIGNDLIYGINDISQYRNKWMHVVAVFPYQLNEKGNPDAELWINGQKQLLSIVRNPTGPTLQTITSTAYISGWGLNSDYPFIGYIDQFRMYKGKLDEKQIKTLYRDINTVITP